jgi:glycosyltransferase involved in cell wall biosynthesis
MARVPVGIPEERIECSPLFGLEAFARFALARRYPRLLEWAILESGRGFCEELLPRTLEGLKGLYVFNLAGLELLKRAVDEGLVGVVEQTIAPYRIEVQLLRNEHSAWPSWETPTECGGRTDEIAERERDEWALAKIIVCGSEFVREGVISSGGPAGRCCVVPYGVDSAVGSRRLRRADHQRAVNVLFAGTLCLRKGIQYLYDAAKRLPRGRFRVRAVGACRLTKAAQKEVAKYIDVTPHVPRSAMAELFAWADVFVLPSICEGSATVIYEALSAGLPVITTRNSGSIVRHGIDGFVVPLRNSEKIVEHLELLLSQPKIQEELSENARARSMSFTVAEYGDRLLATIL